MATIPDQQSAMLKGTRLLRMEHPSNFLTKKER